MFDKGDRVMTPGGIGTVVYRRMIPPTFHEVSAYCVLLDSKKAEYEKLPCNNYSGTVFPTVYVVAV